MGECNTAYTFAYENGIITKNIDYSGTRHTNTFGAVCGTAGRGMNAFSNPDASCPVNGGIFGDPVRDPILGLDGQIGGGGPVTGLPFWNLDLGVNKKIRIKERLSSTLYFDWNNVLNHMIPTDPQLNIYDPAHWGVESGQANVSRELQLGISVDW